MNTKKPGPKGSASSPLRAVAHDAPSSRALDEVMKWLDETIERADKRGCKDILLEGIKIGREWRRYTEMSINRALRDRARSKFLEIQIKGLLARKAKASPLTRAVDEMIENDARNLTPAALAKRLHKQPAAVKSSITQERYSLEYLEKLIRRRLKKRDSTDQ